MFDLDEALIQELAERLLNYANDIVEKKIVACKKHIWAAKKFLHDLEKIEDEDYPYEFDIIELYKFYEWSRLFVHTKGVLAGQPILLTDFQLFVIANIFCWKEKATGYRKVRKVYIQLARKNGKSQLLSLISSYVAFNSPNEVHEVYVSGWNKSTSDIVYDEILKQLRACEFLKDKWSDSYHKITHKKSSSIIKSLSRESKRFGDGLNSSVSILDEFHSHPTTEIYDVLASSQVARKEPLTIIITTSGFNLNAPCYLEYQYVSRLLNPDDSLENESYFGMICEIDEEDDIKDESVWIKANPIVATYEEGLKSLREDLKIALEMQGDKMRNYLTKNLNKWVSMRKSGYMDAQKYARCKEDFTLEDFRGHKCLIGIDLSSKGDLTAVSFLFHKDNHLYVYNHAFLPEDTLEMKRKTDKVPYDQWVKEGYITAIEGEVIDYRYVEKYIMDLEEEYELNILEVCIDSWNDAYLMADMIDKGYTCIQIRQGIQTLGFPTKDFRDRMYMQTIKHDGNPVLQWCFLNSVSKSDINGNIMLDKSKSYERIDCAAATINAMVRVMVLEGIGINDVNEHFASDDWSF